jgi:hypothetical protein
LFILVVCQHYTIGLLSIDGELLESKGVANAFTTQCGCLVRDMVLISIQYWYKPKAAKGEPEEAEQEEGAAVNYITKIMKDRLWEIPHSTFHSAGTETLELAETQKEKVREWALKKMAAQFNNHKKRLWTAYVNADREAPEFTGPNENLRDHWDAFVEYKKSELGKLRSAKNKINAMKKEISPYVGSRWLQDCRA